MGKFDNILLCSDLDGTLLNSDSLLSVKNIESINYFKAEGGTFTITTGRESVASRKYVEQLKPNAPCVIFNGAGIYDYSKNELLWGRYLDENVSDVFEYVRKKIPDVGLLIFTDNQIYINEKNECVNKYYKFEQYQGEILSYEKINERFKKAIFIIDAEYVPKIREIIKVSEYAQAFEFMQSSSHYYEILPKYANKWSAVQKMIEICGFKNKKTVCVGDSENDAQMIKNSDIGVAVNNAGDCLKEVADICINKNNNQDAIAEIIYNIL